MIPASLCGTIYNGLNLRHVRVNRWGQLHKVYSTETMILLQDYDLTQKPRA